MSSSFVAGIGIECGPVVSTAVALCSLIDDVHECLSPNHGYLYHCSILVSWRWEYTVGIDLVEAGYGRNLALTLTPPPHSSFHA